MHGIHNSFKPNIEEVGTLLHNDIVTCDTYNVMQQLCCDLMMYHVLLTFKAITIVTS